MLQRNSLIYENPLANQDARDKTKDLTRKWADNKNRVSAVRLGSWGQGLRLKAEGGRGKEKTEDSRQNTETGNIK